MPGVTVPAAKSAKKTTTSKPARKRPEVTHVEITSRTYFIDESESCPAGREMQHWLEAEAQVRGR